MDIRHGSIFLFIFCTLVLSIGASKCPEPRKPHVTSCTIFYNCINLPEGGYVWAPAKCPDGLVFQPYLRICVLPGDTWTCDTLATESSLTHERYESPGSIDPARTSYLGYTQESSPFTSYPSIGASYPIDGISELGNVREVATPYPLIEIVDTNHKNVNNNNYKITDSAAAPQAIEHRVENYLYQFFNSQQKIPSRIGTAAESKGDSHSTWLKGFINRMLLYENIGEPSKQQLLSPNPVLTQISSTTCEPKGEITLRKGEYINNLSNDMLRYIVQNYILGTRQLDGKLKKKNKKPSTRMTTTIETTEQSDEEIDSISESSAERPIDLVINGPKAENSIVAIKGNLGDKEYVTISKYKTLSRDMQLEVIEILPCAKGIRLPNRTDCTKYYTCDPDTAVTVQFSCSSKTAFNDINRVCEAHRYKACAKKLNEFSELKDSMTDDSIKVSSTSIRTEIPVKKNPCQTTGKFVDPETDRNYYVCYSSQEKSGGIDSIVMSCPNDLIFCQERRLCTTRKRCYD